MFVKNTRNSHPLLCVSVSPSPLKLLIFDANTEWVQSDFLIFFLLEVQNVANELIYLLRAKFLLWWRRVCQSEERGWCRPPTSNLGKDRTTEMFCVKPTRNNMWCWFLENYVCRWLFVFFSENNAMRKCILSTLKRLLSRQVLDEDYILSWWQLDDLRFARCFTARSEHLAIII